VSDGSHRPGGSAGVLHCHCLSSALEAGSLGSKADQARRNRNCAIRENGNRAAAGGGDCNIQLAVIIEVSYRQGGGAVADREDRLRFESAVAIASQGGN